MTLHDYLKQQYVGRILIGCESGMNEKGCQSATLPQKVVNAVVGTYYDDTVLFLKLENGEWVHFATNEEVYFED